MSEGLLRYLNKIKDKGRLFTKKGITTAFSNITDDNKDAIYDIFGKNKIPKQMSDFMSDFIPENTNEANVFNNVIEYMREATNSAPERYGVVIDNLVNSLDDKGYTTKDIYNHVNNLYETVKAQDLHINLSQKDFNEMSVDTALYGKHIAYTESFGSDTPGRIINPNDAYEKAMIMNSNFDKSINYNIAENKDKYLEAYTDLRSSIIKNSDNSENLKNNFDELFENALNENDYINANMQNSVESLYEDIKHGFSLDDSQNINTTPKAMPEITPVQKEPLNTINQDAVQNINHVNNIGAPNKERIGNFHRDGGTKFNNATSVRSPWATNQTQSPKTKNNSRNVNKINDEARAAQQQAEQVKQQSSIPNNATPPKHKNDQATNTKNSSNSISETFKKYKNMTQEELKIHQEAAKAKYSPVKVLDRISSENAVLNAQGLLANQETLKNYTNRSLNPLKTVDRELSKEIEAALNKEINSAKEYFGEIKDGLLNKKGTIKDFEAYGDIVNILSNEDVSDSVKGVLANELSLSGNLLGDEIKDSQLKDFIGKTFKGDSANLDDVDEYMEKVKTYLNSSNSEKLHESIHNIVLEEGNHLKARNKAQEKIVQKKFEKEDQLARDRVNRENAIRREQREAAENKAKREANKQKKKKMSTLRTETGTEGGTLTDFIKGNRGNMLGVGMSAIGAIAEYKEGRNEGKTILGSAADAALSFAFTEAIGLPGAMALGAVKGVTSLGVKGTKYAIESSRSMNNIQRFTPFADAQFQDTQQLATMRQSGMELAKMSQYNLQQTLMGTEARHLHR